MSMRLAVKRSISETVEAEDQERQDSEGKKPVAKKTKTAAKPKKATGKSPQKGGTRNKAPARRAKSRKIEITTDDESEEEDDEEEDPELNDPDEPEYDSEGYIDEEDQKRLNAMPEVEREQVLFDRHKKREEWKELKALRKQQKEKAQHERKTRGAKKPAKRAPAKSRLKRSNKVFSDDSDESEDDDEDSFFSEPSEDEEEQAEEGDAAVSSPSEDEGPLTTVITRRKKESKASSETQPPKSIEKDEPEHDDTATFEDMSKLQVYRHELIKWFDKPFFDKIVGNYVRLFIGVPEQNRSLRTYRVCEIMEVQECKPYKVDGKSVNQALVLRFGRSEKLWKMEKVSNSPFTNTEYEFWKKFVKEQIGNLPTKEDALEIFQARMKQIVNYVFTEQEINEMVARKKRARKRTNNIAMARTEIERNLKAAREKGDILGEKEYLKQLKMVEAELNAIKERRQDATTNVNDRNMKKNISQLNDIVKDKQRKRKQELESGKVAEVTNWNVRAPTRPTTLWSTKTGSSSTAAAKPKAPKSEETPQPTLARQDSVDSMTTTPVTTVSSVHAKVNLDIDLSSAEKTEKPKVVPQVASAGVVKKKKGMSLGEYWRRQLPE